MSLSGNPLGKPRAPSPSRFTGYPAAHDRARLASARSDDLVGRERRLRSDHRAYQSAFADGVGVADDGGAVGGSGAGVGVEKYRKKSDFGLISARVCPLLKLF